LCNQVREQVIQTNYKQYVKQSFCDKYNDNPVKKAACLRAVNQTCNTTNDPSSIEDCFLLESAIVNPTVNYCKDVKDNIMQTVCSDLLEEAKNNYPSSKAIVGGTSTGKASIGGASAGGTSTGGASVQSSSSYSSLLSSTYSTPSTSSISSNTLINYCSQLSTDVQRQVCTNAVNKTCSNICNNKYRSDCNVISNAIYSKDLTCPSQGWYNNGMNTLCNNMLYASTNQ
jgi:hypothetical protein